jgi:hypothetical protein
MPRTFSGEADEGWVLTHRLDRNEEREPRVYRARRDREAERRLEALARSLNLGRPTGGDR